MSENIAIIFAGGSGVRLGSGLPKQFLEIKGKPIIVHTLEVFQNHPQIEAIYVACKEEYIPRCQSLVERYQLGKVAKIVPGGANGQESIYAALSAAEESHGSDAVALIHDGVRPFISEQLIDDCLASCAQHGNAVVCAALTETPMLSSDGQFVEELPSRDSVFLVKAPQCFRLGEVLQAHRALRERGGSYEGIIDTCTLMKLAGYQIALVKGPRSNVKATLPEDVYIFRALFDYIETESVFGLAQRDMEPGSKD